MNRWVWLAAIAGLGAAPAEQKFQVFPEAGNSTFSAVFEAKLGERINAMSSAVKCELVYAPGTVTVSGHCSVPLTSIRVDNEDTKTEHFQQWATNKKGAPARCSFDAQLKAVKLQAPLDALKPVEFAGDLPFTLCGRARSDGAPEHVTGTAVLLPAGEGRSADTIKIRARIESFNRDAYRVGPKYTEGWLSRVQQLAPVVSEEGSIEFSLFAKGENPKAQP